MIHSKMIDLKFLGLKNMRPFSCLSVQRPINYLISLLLYTALTAHAAGDPKAGADKSLVCSACHGAQGISTNPEWPHLAGQHAAYLIKELHDFKQGKTRATPIMGPMVAHLTDQDIDDLAAYYSQKPRALGKTPETYLARGAALYRNGDISKHITACIACHGPDGRGNAQAGFPLLCGQSPAYTVQQLHAFKSGARSNDMSSIMHDISSHMSDEDMEAVAHYLTGMP